MTVPTPPPAVDWRGRFPFRIGAPSWVFPFASDNVVSNVRYLSRSVDRVQLLLFGRDYLEEMLVPDDLARLALLRQETGLRFSVHLPSDLYLLDCCVNPPEFSAALAVIARIFHLTAALEPESFILHIDGQGQTTNADARALSRRFELVLTGLCQRFPEAGQRILVENTTIDLVPLADCLARTGFGICADFGHLWHNGLSLPKFLSCFGPHIRELHLHGFNASGDHLALNQLDTGALSDVSSFLGTFRGVVTLEIFQAQALWPSLAWLADYLEIKQT